jgi:hypothetical protein
MNTNAYRQLENLFTSHADSHWAHLSRFNNLLIILNISLFFLTDLVIRQGYYDTYYSLLFLLLTAMGPLIGFGLLNRLWYYLIFVLSETAGSYFLVVSAWYWVRTNSGS